MNRLLLVRHGDIAADMSRYWGRTDVSLSVDGLKQAEKLCHCLASERIDVVYSSDLKRALDTATVIAMPHHLSVMTCPKLREIDFGQCEGLTFHEIKERYPEAERLWNAVDPEINFPSGESVKALARRVDIFMARLLLHPADTALVVAHGGPLRVLICLLLGRDLSEWQQLHIERASLSVIEVNGHQGMLQFLNDVSHLQGGRK